MQNITSKYSNAESKKPILRIRFQIRFNLKSKTKRLEKGKDTIIETIIKHLRARIRKITSHLHAILLQGSKQRDYC